MIDRDLPTIHRAVTDLAAEWLHQRRERLTRRALDPSDFAALASAGMLLASVPRDHGGVFASVPESLRGVAELLRIVATVDPSVALVASMHPGVLSQWLAFAEASRPELDVEWQEQRRFAFDTAKAGHWWGTITSEPGSGGDLSATTATATAVESKPGQYLLSGDKHFGSGSGVTSFMVTTAVPSDGSGVDLFFIDQRGRPWDGSQGCTLVAPWDGFGMTATQSHAMRFEQCPVTRFARHGFGNLAATAVGAANLLCFVAVVLGVVEAAVSEARAQLKPKADKLRPYELTEWGLAVNEAWLFTQAYEGALREVESGRSATAAAIRAKVCGAQLAESCLERICRVVGGGTFSQRSPFGQWRQDVRALGFLRPPWALAHDNLAASAWES